MWWKRKARYAEELAQAEKRLRQVRSRTGPVERFAEWVDRHLEENHFSERMLLGLEHNHHPRRKR